MATATGSRRWTTAAFALLFAALALVASGLPRLLVVCVGTDGSTHLSFAHGAGECGHSHADAAASAGASGHGCCHGHRHGSLDGGERRDDGAPRADTGEDHGSVCTDLRLPPGEAPAPTTEGGTHPWIAMLPATITAPRPRVAASLLLPPTTGPPRGDDRTALRRCIVLLV